MNSSSTGQYMSVLERTLFGLAASLPCLLCLWVNVMMLWTLRSRAVFRETPRFLMLLHLLLADTVQLVMTQTLFLLSFLRVLMHFPLCLLLVLSSHMVHDFGPLVLVLMSLERFVAVCLPLRHSTIATARNTTWVCLGAWALTASNILLRLGFTLQGSPSARPYLLSQMKDHCHSMVLFLGPHSRLLDEVLVYSLFLIAFLTIGGSYAAVMRVARSASSDQGSARKARTTLLLHLVQLGFIMSSTFHDALSIALYTEIPRLAFVRSQTVLYILLIILPKCLSVLVYGLRDPTIRDSLLRHLSCRGTK